MKRMLFLTLLIGLLLAGSCWAADFSLLLNDKSVQGRLNYAFDRNEYGESFADFRLLYNDDKETLLGTVAGGVQGEPGNIPGLKFGAELLGNFGTSENNQDLISLGLGLRLSYQPPQLQGVGAYVRAQYSPELLSLLDSDGMFEHALGLSYMITPRAGLMVEYQRVRVDFGQYGKTSIDEELRGGVLLNF